MSEQINDVDGNSVIPILFATVGLVTTIVFNTVIGFIVLSAGLLAFARSQSDSTILNGIVIYVGLLTLFLYNNIITALFGIIAVILPIVIFAIFAKLR